MDDTILKQEFEVLSGDFNSAGSSSAKIKKNLKQLGIESDIIRRAAIVAYEAEMNLVIHSLGGRLGLAVTPEAVIITTEDVGPGIADIGLALKEGYSTASDDIRDMGFGAGMGLPNMKRNCDDFSIKSSLGEGTYIRMLINLQ